jgi:fumarate hydratase subunit beta
LSTQSKILELPVSPGKIAAMRTGDMFRLNGVIYTARDKAHQRLAEMVARKEKLPVELKNQFVYFVGPSPAPPGRVIGSAGPTTSSRMDPFTRVMLDLGVTGFIGKGKRSVETRALLKEYGAVYFSSFGGAGAYLSDRITVSEIVAFDDLGPEAIYRLTVSEFPVIVVNDSLGGDLYELQIRK